VKNLRIVVAGGGERNILDRFSHYSPLVKVLGWVRPSDIRSLFRISDLTLLPSVWHENLPVVIFESSQVGTPVVGSNFGGIPELITEGKTGYLVPPGDPVALAEKVIMHFAAPAVRQRRMRQACYQQVSTDLTLAQHIDGLLDIYKEVLSR
jgi:glycosyltransferase involved in cell wall biosynthesis